MGPKTSGDDKLTGSGSGAKEVVLANRHNCVFGAKTGTKGQVFMQVSQNFVCKIDFNDFKSDDDDDDDDDEGIGWRIQVCQ